MSKPEEWERSIEEARVAYHASREDFRRLSQRDAKAARRDALRKWNDSALVYFRECLKAFSQNRPRTPCTNSYVHAVGWLTAIAQHFSAIQKEAQVLGPDFEEMKPEVLEFVRLQEVVDRQSPSTAGNLRSQFIRAGIEECWPMENPAESDKRIEPGWFVVGCVLLGIAIGFAVWAFKIGTLSEDRRILLKWILPLASGFAVGAFAGSFSVKARQFVPGLLIVATGGFGVWLLTFWLLFPGRKQGDEPMRYPPPTPAPETIRTREAKASPAQENAINHPVPPDASPFEQAGLLFAQGAFAEAEAAALEATKIAKDSVDGLKALELAGWSAISASKFNAALEHFRKAVALTDRARDGFGWAKVQRGIGMALQLSGRPDLSEPIFREVRKESERALGVDHQDALADRQHHANALTSLEKYDEAEALHRANLEIRTRKLGPYASETNSSRAGLANVYLFQRKWALARAENEQLIRAFTEAGGAEDANTLNARTNWAFAATEMGDLKAAEKVNREVLEIRTRVLGIDHPDTLTTRNNLANCLASQGLAAGAEKEHRALLESNLRVFGPESENVYISCFNIAISCAAQNKLSEALVFARRSEEGFLKNFGPKYFRTMQARDRRILIERTIKNQRH